MRFVDAMRLKELEAKNANLKEESARGIGTGHGSFDGSCEPEIVGQQAWRKAVDQRPSR